MLEVTSRQFRENQKSYFDLADEGRQIIIKRGRKQSYVLTPVNEDDFYFTPEMEARIEKAMQQIKEGKYSVINNKDELKQFFNNL